MNGFLLINKPTGITSFDVVRKLRKILNLRKIGHAGTLDPLAEGLMILALGEGTKLLEFLLKENKTYEAEVTLGKESDTYDAEGVLKNISAKEISNGELKKALQKFRGKIQQIPPKYSALKINGQKAYELARQGKEVEMKVRDVEVFGIEILEYIYPTLKLKIDCSTGTYIRSIAHDLGQELKVGGYLTKLKRTKIGKYVLGNSVSLEEVEVAKILPLEWGVADLNQIDIASGEAKLLKNGQQIKVADRFKDDELIACLFEDKLVSIAKFLSKTKKLQPVKNFVSK